jgi:hypothetical protein
LVRLFKENIMKAIAMLLALAMSTTAAAAFDAKVCKAPIGTYARCLIKNANNANGQQACKVAFVKLPIAQRMKKC